MKLMQPEVNYPFFSCKNIILLLYENNWLQGPFLNELVPSSMLLEIYLCLWTLDLFFKIFHLNDSLALCFCCFPERVKACVLDFYNFPSSHTLFCHLIKVSAQWRPSRVDGLATQETFSVHLYS